MNSSKAVQIMRSLSQEELKEFSRFVVSPYFNRLKDVTKLFGILQNFHPQYGESQVDKTELFKKLFPSKPYNDARMRNLVSDLGQLAEKYLCIKSQEKDNVYNRTAYMNYLLSRKLYGLFEKSFRKAENTGKELSSHFRKYLMEAVKGNYFLYTNRQHKAPASSYEKFDSLVGFYLNTMVRALYDFKVHKNMNDYEAPSLLKEFVSSFDFRGFRAKAAAGGISESERDYIDIQFYLYELLTGGNFEENLNRLLDLASKYEKTMTQQEKYDIYLNLSNLLAFKIYEDGLDYSHLRLKVFKETIAKQAYFHETSNAVMPLIMFFTGVNLALQIGQLGFIEFMLENLIHITPSESRQSLASYTKAQLEFANGNFEASLTHLSKVSYEIIPLRKHVKNLTLILYYELGHYDSAASLVSSYRQYLKRTGGFKGMYGEWYDNFLRFYSGLLEKRAQGEQGINDSGDIKNRLNNTLKVLFKPWLLEKMG
jgi:hypothetical protein